MEESDTTTTVDGFLDYCLKKYRYCNNVDSLFQSNFDYFERKLCDAPKGMHVVIRDSPVKIFYERLFPVLSGHEEWIAKNVILMKVTTIDEKTFAAIRGWYMEHKDFITCDDVTKAFISSTMFLMTPASEKLERSIDWYEYWDSLGTNLHKEIKERARYMQQATGNVDICTADGRIAEDFLKEIGDTTSKGNNYAYAARLQEYCHKKYPTYCTDCGNYFKRNIDKLDSLVQTSDAQSITIEWGCDRKEECVFLTIVSCLGFEDSELILDEDIFVVSKPLIGKLEEWHQRNSCHITEEDINHYYITQVYIPHEIIALFANKGMDWAAIYFFDILPKNLRKKNF